MTPEFPPNCLLSEQFIIAMENVHFLIVLLYDLPNMLLGFTYLC